jgi:hypothetical protein
MELPTYFFNTALITLPAVFFAPGFIDGFCCDQVFV